MTSSNNSGMSGAAAKAYDRATNYDIELKRQANERRMLLQQRLLDEAMQLLSRKREIPVVLNDEENNMVQHQVWEGNGTALNICEVKVQDVTPEQFIDYFKH